MSPTKSKPFVRQTTAERQQNLAERVNEARLAEKRKPAHIAPYVEYKNVDPAVETALYYGFTPLGCSLCITKEDRDTARSLGAEDRTEPFSFAPTAEEKAAMLRHYAEKGFQDGPQPVMFCTEFLPTGSSKKKSGERRFSLEIMGSSKSIAEATLIQTAFATLREEGHTELTLSINSIGDRESMNRFVRELGNFYRKHIPVLPASCRTLLRKNPIDLLRCDHEKCKGLSEEAPKSMSFLGDESRRHFKEVLEFLEALEIPYRIDHRLLGSRSFATETLFEIYETTPEGEKCLASGVRYNNLGKRVGLKRECPSVGLNLILPKVRKENGRRIRFKKPRVFFLHLGFCAKLKSLHVVETLRKAQISLYQALSRDKLTSQISSAEHLKIPYSLILGQREAFENSVIVRNTVSRSQETVPLHRLVEYFKKIKIG